MRIAWFTPFHPHAAIGAYSRAIAEALAAAGEDVVISVPAGPDAPMPWSGETVVFDDADAPTDRFAGFDLCVYNLGNHPGNHRLIYRQALRQPGIAILHDLVLRDFFRGYADLLPGNRERFFELQSLAEGAEGAALGEAERAGRYGEALDNPERLRMPMFAPALWGALGAVVHSEFTRREVAGRAGCPVAKLDFPGIPDYTGLEWAGPSKPGEPVRLLTFGHLGANKAIHLTIDAIARDPALRAGVQFDIVGAPDTEEYRNFLDERIRGHGLERSVRQCGRVSETELRERLRTCDTVVNLRVPHCGESSWSLLSSLSVGVPTVVWNHGTYAEFPDDAVMKVSDERELEAALAALVSDADLRRRMGRAAGLDARTRFSAARYVAGFRAFADEVLAGRPILHAASAAARALADVVPNADEAMIDGLAGRLAGWAPRQAALAKAA